MKSRHLPLLFLPLAALALGQDQDRRANATHSREGFTGNSAYEPVHPSPKEGEARRTFTPTVFPPPPPVLGAPLSNATVPTEVELPAHLQPLRSHLYDSLYAPLAYLLLNDDLHAARAAGLESYRASRRSALTELRNGLDAARNLAPAARAAELSALAARQSGPLAALEREADQLHLILMRDVSVLHGVEWDTLRLWNHSRALTSAELDDLNLTLSAAFFHDGLSLDQRLLLRETAIEITARRSATPDAATEAIFFSPFTARIRAPAGATPEIAVKLQAYQAKKAELKRQLHDELRAHDLNFFTATRTTALKALAARQAPEFAALETLAEEIRVALAALPASEPPAAPALPEALARRLSAYLVAKTDWQKSMLRQVAAWRAKLPGLRIELAGLDGVPHIEFKAGPSGASPGAADLAALAEFNRLQQAAYETLGRDKETLTAEIGRTLGTANGGEKSVDQLIAEFGTALGRLDTRLRYRDYETAVLQPGLSPAQRRLLFSAALEQLDLTLLAR